MNKCKYADRNSDCEIDTRYCIAEEMCRCSQQQKEKQDQIDCQRGAFSHIFGTQYNGWLK